MEVRKLKYIRLSADYLEPSIIDQQEGRTSPQSLSLSSELQDVLEDWNLHYQSIIQLSMKERSSGQVKSEIDRLDSEGMVIAQKIATELGDCAKVEYYSEGLLKRINT
ncbi:hypothetical protein CBI38_00235 [Rhodococcus oxybenzonivorans]|uniref:Uncharacterized protein n=1 Tax=Rhodococcus oxybenzonivorans TaxID=1990687 RepID=A0A2S2BNN1_9NOCA|nr:hypothetical protein CBI38_00235 [Rhodococcus oxybenzonivorans]